MSVSRSELEGMTSSVVCSEARSVSEAVELATRAVEVGGGGVVLFSPAAPTPPSEGTYVDRSAEFMRAVQHQVDMHNHPNETHPEQRQGAC